MCGVPLCSWRPWRRGVALAALALATLWAGSLQADEDEIEAAGASLVGLDGAPFDLTAVVAAHEATVLVWYATECPCVGRYGERIAALRAAWPSERVAVVGVASNADDDAGQVQAALAERGFPVPVVLDPGGALADALDIVSTPTVVLLDGRGEVRFQGWIDNERLPGDDDREAYLDAAIESVLGLRTDAPDASPVYGCPLTRSW